MKWHRRQTVIFFLLSSAFLKAQPPQTLPGTQPPEREGDITLQMLQGIDRFLLNETEASLERRKRHWSQDFSSPRAYEASIGPNRKRFLEIIGLVDERVEFVAPDLDATTARPSLIGKGDGYEVNLVRWPVLEGVEAEGLLLEPAGSPTGSAGVGECSPAVPLGAWGWVRIAARRCPSPRCSNSLRSRPAAAALSSFSTSTWIGRHVGSR